MGASSVGAEDYYDPLESFFASGDHSRALTTTSNGINRFCDSTTIEDLERSLSSTSIEDPNILLLSSTDHTGAFGARKNLRGPLSARELYESLRSHSSKHFVPQTGETEVPDALCESNGVGGAEELEALDIGDLDDRATSCPPTGPWVESGASTNEARNSPDWQILYLPNLDSVTMWVLVATVSTDQADALRQALQRHFSSETFAQIEVSAKALNLSFHLPFIAWRTSKSLPLDVRRDRQCRPLREVEDVTQFDWESDLPSFIYFGHYSCVMTGIDKSKWTAYCFDDSVPGFESLNPSPTRLVDMPEMRPCHQADFAPHDPVAYFLMLFDAHIQSMYQEWVAVVDHIELAIKDRSQRPSQLSDWPSAAVLMKIDIKWLHKALLLIGRLIFLLRRTTGACDRFLDEVDVNHDLSSNASVHVYAAQRSLSAMADLEQRLESVECEAKMSLMLTLDSHKLLDSHEKSLAGDNKTVAVILLLCTPIVITTAIFSMDDSVIQRTLPGLPLTPTSFFTVFAVFSTVVWCLAWQQRLIHLRIGHRCRFILAQLASYYKRTMPQADFPKPTYHVETGLAGRHEVAGLQPLPPKSALHAKSLYVHPRAPEKGFTQQVGLSSHHGQNDTTSPAFTAKSAELSATEHPDKHSATVPATGHHVKKIPQSRPSYNRGPATESVLPLYNLSLGMSQSNSSRQPTRATQQLRGVRQPSLSLQERNLRQSGHGEFIYACLSDNACSQVHEMNAHDFDDDKGLIRSLHDCCCRRWSALFRPLTMSTFDKVYLKRFDFLSNESHVRCTEHSELPGDAMYKHHGPDVHCREDMISHDFQRCIDSFSQVSRAAGELEDPLPGQERMLLDAIPKKYPWRLAHQKGNHGWCIQVRLRFCYRRLTACVVLWAIGSAVWISIWLQHSSRSLQEAFTPPGMVLVVLTFYANLMRWARN